MKNIKNYTKLIKIIACILVCAVFLLTGCSGIETMLTNESTPTPTPTVQQTAEPEYGGELFIAYPKDTESFDPILAQNEDLINLLSLIYETPLVVDSTGKIGPGLVENWQTDDSKTEFTFSLREGVTFHDGQPLTAADLYATIMDILKLDGTAAAGNTVNAVAPATEGEPDGENTDAANLGTPTYIEMWTAGDGTEAAGDVTGETANGTTADSNTAEKTNRYTLYNGDIESVTLVDDYTIRLKMKNPGRSALYFMTFPVRPKGLADFAQPVGSGPYKVNSIGEEIQLSVNENWWKVSPYIQAVVAKPLVDQKEKLEAYESGILDFITTDDIAANKLKAEGMTQTVDYLTYYYDCLIPNLFDESMKNDYVRKALSYAIDRRNIISNVLLNHAVAAEMPIVPSFFAFNPDYNLYEYDKSMAKKYLAGAGYRTSENGAGNALNVTLIVPNKVGEEYRVEAARAIAGQLADVGIECTLEELTPEDYAARLESGNYTLAYASYYLDQNMDVSFLFQPDGPDNFGHVASTELMDAITACNEAVTETEMISAYDALEKYFMDNVPQIGLYFRMHSIVADASVTGISGVFENRVFENISDWSVAQNH